MIPLKNRRQIERGVKLILQGLGEDPTREGLRDTPTRVSKMYADILDGNFADEPRVAMFEEESYNGVVMIHHVPYFSFCEHHMMPFTGEFAIAYVPDKKIIGVSKLVRIFRHRCKRVTIQERLVSDAADDLMRLLEAKGVMVYAEAQHMCMTHRGVKSPGSRMTTSSARGVFLTNDVTRQQFMEVATK